MPWSAGCDGRQCSFHNPATVHNVSAAADPTPDHGTTHSAFHRVVRRHDPFDLFGLWSDNAHPRSSVSPFPYVGRSGASISAGNIRIPFFPDQSKPSLTQLSVPMIVRPQGGSNGFRNRRGRATQAHHAGPRRLDQLWMSPSSELSNVGKGDRIHFALRDAFWWLFEVNGHCESGWCPARRCCVRVRPVSGGMQ